MPRPRKFRTINFCPRARYYKPQGIPLRILEEAILTTEEMEALRLKYEQNLDQENASKKMGISQPTFHRTLDSAQTKIAKALLEGKAIKISE